MSGPDLHQSAWELAKANAAGTYKSSQFGLATAGVTVLAAAGAILLTVDEKPPIIAAMTVLVGIAGIFGCLSVVLAFQSFTAPIRQRNELRRIYGEIASGSALDVGVRLHDLARQGDDLLSSCRANGGYSKDDEAAIEAWTKSVVSFLAGAAPDLAIEFAEASRGTTPLLNRLEKRIAVLDSSASART